MFKRKIIFQSILIVCLLPVLAATVWCEIQIFNLSSQRSEIKKDYSKVNGIEYGLLSVNAWRDNVEEIVTNRVQDFTLTPAQEKILRGQISIVLNNMITEVDSMVQHNSHTLKGKLTKMAVNTFVNWKNIRAKVPAFSQTILNDVKKPKNRQQLQDLLLQKVNELAAMTYDSTLDSNYLKRVLIKYTANSLSDFKVKSTNQIDALQDKTYNFSFVVLGVMFFFLVLWLLLYRQKELVKPLFVLSVLLALTVLLVGLTSPMIEIDARIKKLDFLLLGEHIQFTDQVLFYQSKSILDVVEILLATKKIDSLLVGVLILVFSVLFPITKLISTEFYLFGNEKIKKNKLIQFFALKSGKWSMADVMVVAIFMAYVGFKGIFDNQLQGINMDTKSLHSITTNLTSLQPGFILFVAFVLFGLILSEILKRISEGVTILRKRKIVRKEG